MLHFAQHTGEFFFHVFRENNNIADALASHAISNGSRVCFYNPWPFETPPRFIQIWSDGGHKNGTTSCGWWVQAANDLDDGRPIWKDVCMVAVKIADNDQSNSTMGEMYGAFQAVLAAASLLLTGRIFFDNDCLVIFHSSLAEPPTFGGLL